MTSKNGAHPNGGNTDPIGESVEKVLKLYDRIKQGAAGSIKREPVEAFGETLWVRTLSGDDRDDFEGWVAARRAEAAERGEEASIRGIRAKVVVLCATDEAGNRLFTDDDADWIGDADGLAIERIFAVADRLSGLTPQAQETIAKNSAATPGVASPSPSPSDSAAPVANSLPTSTPPN